MKRKGWLLAIGFAISANVAGRLEACNDDLALLDRLASDLTACDSEEDIERLESGLREKGWLPAAPAPRTARRKAGGGKRAGPGLSIPCGDYEILVGKKDVDNDRITFGVARGNDWWLHPLHVAGPHVLIRPGGPEPPPREVVIDAGQLALYFSRLRRSGKGDVMLTQKKYIRRAKGSKPGSVVCQRYSTVYVEIDEERVQEMLKRSGG